MSERTYQKTALVIMAAGMGNRFGGLKQLVSVGPCGETIMDYSVYNAIKAGFQKVVFIIRKNFEAEFRQKVLSKYTERIHCEVAFQEIDALPHPFVAPKTRQTPWGTGHALLMAKELVASPFCVINADDYYGPEAFLLMHQALAEKKTETTGDYYAVCYSLGNTLSESGTVSRGICTLASDGTLQKVEEYKTLRTTEERQIVDEATGRCFTSNQPVSMNFWGFTPDYFAHSERLFEQFLEKNSHIEGSEFYIPTIVSHLIATGKAQVKVMQTGDSWFGVTYAEDRPYVEARLAELHREQVYPTPLFS